MGNEAVGDPTRFVCLHHKIVTWRGGGDVARKWVAIGWPSTPIETLKFWVDILIFLEIEVTIFMPES